jgi:hypothetical protein
MNEIKFRRTRIFDKEHRITHPHERARCHSRGNWISKDNCWHFESEKDGWKISAFPYGADGSEAALERQVFLQKFGLDTTRFPSRKDVVAALALALKGSGL